MEECELFMWEFWYISKLKKINKISGIFYVTILVYIPKVDRRTYTPKVFTERQVANLRPRELVDQLFQKYSKDNFAFMGVFI